MHQNKPLQVSSKLSHQQGIILIASRISSHEDKKQTIHQAKQVHSNVFQGNSKKDKNVSSQNIYGSIDRNNVGNTMKSSTRNNGTSVERQKMNMLHASVE